MQSFNRCYRIASENEVVSKCLHCQYANVVFQENRQDLMLKTAELVAVHDIRGSWTASKRKPFSAAVCNILRCMEGSLCPVNPIWRILPAFLASKTAS